MRKMYEQNKDTTIHKWVEKPPENEKNIDVYGRYNKITTKPYVQIKYIIIIYNDLHLLPIFLTSKMYII